MLESPGTSKRYNHRDAADKELAILCTSVHFREGGTPKVSGPGTSEGAVTSRHDGSSTDVARCFLIGSSTPDL